MYVLYVCVMGTPVDGKGIVQSCFYLSDCTHILATATMRGRQTDRQTDRQAGRRLSLDPSIARDFLGWIVGIASQADSQVVGA
jgi:hypothetical protein